jgi:hypothetical protein
MDDYSHTDGGEPDRNGTYRDDGREATSNTPVADVLQTSAENRDRNTQQPHSYPRPPLEVDVIRQSHNQSTGAGLPQHQQQIPMMNMNMGQSQVQYNDANALLLQQLLQQVQTANAPPPIQLYQGITTGRVPAGAAAASTHAQLQATTNAIYIAPFSSPSTSHIPISVPPPPTAAASNVTVPSATSDATSSFIVANLAATNPQDIMTAIQQLVAQIQPQPTAAAGTRPAQILPPPVAPIHISAAAPALPPQQQFVPSDSAGVAAGDPISLILSNLAVPRNNAAGASTTLTALGTTSGTAQPAHQQYNNILCGLIQMLVQQQQQQPTPATTGSAAGGIHLTPQQLLEAMTQPTTASGATMPTSGGIPSMIWHPQQQMNATALQGASGSSQSMTTVYGQAPEYSLTRQPQIQQHHQAQQRPVTSSLVTSTMSSFTTSDAAGAGSSSSLPQPTSSSSSSTSSLMTGRSPVSLYLDFDSTSLNEFQCLLRQQIEVRNQNQRPQCIALVDDAVEVIIVCPTPFSAFFAPPLAFSHSYPVLNSICVVLSSFSIE